MPNLLSGDEHRALELTAELARLLSRIVADGPTAPGDLRELTSNVHAIQQAVMSQAAARAYPEKYRLLGGAKVGDRCTCPRVEITTLGDHIEGRAPQFTLGYDHACPDHGQASRAEER